MGQTAIKIVHTSDVHLDSRFGKDEAEGYRNVAERAFAAVIDLTITQSADLFLIAGDLFDSNRIHDRDIEFVYSELNRAQCPVVLIPGNHDVHDERSVWNRVDFTKAGSHVHALMEHEGRTVELDEIGASIWGKAMAEHAPENLPLEGVVERPTDYWHIGMAHGYAMPKRAGIGASPITHGEIGDSELDYLALGHVHVWGELDHGRTKARYSGSPVAEFASSAGGHVAIATLHPERGVDVERHLVSEPKERPAVIHGIGY